MGIRAAKDSLDSVGVRGGNTEVSRESDPSELSIGASLDSVGVRGNKRGIKQEKVEITSCQGGWCSWIKLESGLASHLVDSVRGSRCKTEENRESELLIGVKLDSVAIGESKRVHSSRKLGMFYFCD